MRLLQFEEGGQRRIGLELKQNGDILDICQSDPSLPTDMRSFIELGDEAMNAIKRIKQNDQNVLRRENVRVLAPIHNPEKVLCVGMNYRDHCEEQNVPLPKEPVIFNKFPSCIIGPTDDIQYPDEAQTLDWEVELAIVIGRPGKRIKETEAMDYVFGYTVAHDVSARDLYAEGRNAGQVTLGKAMDCFCPMGPVIVTKEDVEDPHNLKLRCLVNNKLKQESNTNQLVHKTEACIAFISRFITLKPGDIILTGSPQGSGAFRHPPEYLKKGDVVVCEIEGIGRLENKIV